MPPEPPPIPISAGWLIEFTAFQVSFDRPLTAGRLDNRNWSVRTNGFRRDFALATAAGNNVGLLNPGIPGFVPGPDQVRYLPPPFDLLSSAGTPAAGFTFLY